MDFTHGLFSAVDRVVEHPDVWRRRLSSSKWGERIPHIERSANCDYWVIDDCRIALTEIAQLGAVTDNRLEGTELWEEVLPVAYDATERLKAMDQDGVDCSVLYPTVAGFSGETLGRIRDPELEIDCVRAYNDWLVEEWLAVNSRFIPQCIVPIGSVEAAVKEIRRAVGKGHKGVLFPSLPMGLRDLPHINGPEYDPIWAVCQELGVPLCFHAGSTREFQFPLLPGLSRERGEAMEAVTRSASAVFDLVNILFSRILLRFPLLKVVFAESTIGWGTFILEYADHQYEQDHCNYEWKPSEMFRRQCYLTTWYDPVKINAQHIGTENILWATNFPVANSTWPDSHGFASRCLIGMDTAARERILWKNAAALYKL